MGGGYTVLQGRIPIHCCSLVKRLQVNAIRLEALVDQVLLVEFTLEEQVTNFLLEWTRCEGICLKLGLVVCVQDTILVRWTMSFECCFRT